MGPVVIARVTGAYLAVPVKRETYLIQLFAIAADVVGCGDGRVLPRLDGILLGRQSIAVVAHGVEHIEALQPFVAGIDVAGNVAEGVTHMQSRTTGIGEHVQHVVLRP